MWRFNLRSRIPLESVQAGFLAGDAALAAWLIVAQRAFLGQRLPSFFALLAFAGGAASLALATGFHRFTARRFRWFLVKALLFAPATALLAAGLGSSWREAAWLAVALAVALIVFRAAFYSGTSAGPTPRFEVARWIFLGGIATVLTWPCYRADAPVDGGGALTPMLADFVTQIRAGIFPVWVGQSDYAFDGTVVPLRFAPWFQHVGACVDFASAHALNFAGLNNATSALAGLATIATAYFFLRQILPSRPGLACVLAALFVASPTVLGPLVSPDRSLLALALPLVPLALWGCWRIWVQDGVGARVALAAGLGGLWLSHTPTALGMTLFVLASSMAQTLFQQRSSREFRSAFLTLGLFAGLSLLPVVSFFLTDTRAEIAPHFPFAISAFTPGYAALAAFALAMILLRKAQPRGAACFVIATWAVAFLAVFAPDFSEAAWSHASDWLRPMIDVRLSSSLGVLGTALMFFSFAAIVRDERFAARDGLMRFLMLLLLGAGGWSWREAQRSKGPIIPHVLPGEVSHGDVDARLENHLLDRATLGLLTANADRAAPLVRIPAPAEVLPRLEEAGTLMAVEHLPDHFELEPALSLSPHRRHALRLEFLRPEAEGQLEVVAGDVHRRYALPDAGKSSDQTAVARTFGSLPTRSHVLSFKTEADGAVQAHFQFVSTGKKDPSRVPSARYAFARYWLYTYEAADLAVKVDSLLPYRARTDVARDAWLETPRRWLQGYRATVNGQPAKVARSPDDLVMIALPAGQSAIALDYFAPVALRAAFWLCLLCWVALGFETVRRMLAVARRPSASLHRSEQGNDLR